MINVEKGQFWEVYSNLNRQWSRAIVMTIQNNRAYLRHVGFVELFTVAVDDLKTKPELFRQGWQ